MGYRSNFFIFCRDCIGGSISRMKSIGKSLEDAGKALLIVMDEQRRIRYYTTNQKLKMSKLAVVERNFSGLRLQMWTALLDTDISLEGGTS